MTTRTDIPSTTTEADFRSTFRQFAAGVVVITADAGAGPVGFTATSLASVSLRPPLVSFALSTTASSWPTIAATGGIVINFLDATQHWIATQFATSGIDRFAAPVNWFRLGTGEPVLDGTPGHLRGEVEHRHTVGDHQLVIARVTHTAVNPHAPLVYHDGSYGTVRRH